MKPPQRTSFNKKGYYKTAIDLTPNEITKLIVYCNNLRYKAVFRSVGGEQDNYRSQAIVKHCAATKQLFETVSCALNQACPLWEIKEVVALRSEPAGPIQDIHRDIALRDVESATKETGYVPVGAIIGLMPDTRLRVYNGCFGDTVEVDQGRKCDVAIGVAECLIFRGDLAHCGLSYKTRNYRIHCAIGIGDTNWVANQTHPVVVKSFDCKCGSSFGTANALTHHLRWCKQCGDLERVNEVRNRYNELNHANVACPICNRVYTRKSSLRSHIQRKHKTG